MAQYTSAKQEVDKKLLYGKFQDSEDRRARFAERIAHKAADLAMEDDPMRITNTKTGIGTAGAMGIAGIAGLPGIILATLSYMGGDKTPDVAPQPPPVASSPADSDYSVTFYDKDGNLIEVPRLPPELRKAAQ